MRADNHGWVDPQRFARVVTRHFKGHPVAAAQGIASVDQVPFIADHLINHRLALQDLRTRPTDQEVAIGLFLHRLCAFELDADSRRIGARGKGEIVLQLTLVSVDNQIDSRIYAAHRNLTVIGDVSAPLRGIVADEIVGDARKLIEWFDFRMLVGALKFHAHRSAGLVLSHQYYFLASEIEDEARPACEVLHLRVGLPFILLKAEGQLRIGVPPLRRRRNFRIERKAGNNQKKTSFQHKNLHRRASRPILSTSPDLYSWCIEYRIALTLRQWPHSHINPLQAH